MRVVRFAITFGYMLLVLATAAVPLLGGPRPYAPVSILPQPQPVTLHVVYGTEKETWLREAATAFQASGATVDGAPIMIDLRGMGSGESKDALVADQIQPDVWSPASDLWITLLNQERQRRQQAVLVPTTGADAPKLLVLTPLVLAAWQDRAAALGNSGNTVWQNLQTTVVEGWQAKGHPEWGNATWGHTTPTSSNSGLQTLLLLAYDYGRKSRDLTVADVQQPPFVEWLRGIEGGASFGDSSASLMNDMIAFGPAKYNVVATYENLALEQIPNARNRGNKLVLIYPPANMWSNHPYAILDAPWVTPVKREAARQFRDFLLSRPQQTSTLR